MRISDWSSDVCSSDLMDVVDTRTVAADFFSRRITQRGAVADVVIDAETVRRKLRNEAGQRLRGKVGFKDDLQAVPTQTLTHRQQAIEQNGSAAWRERVGQ